MHVDVAVIGGGPAGLAAAISAYKSGAKHVLVLERDTSLGGILNQCIHSGFGLHYFKEELTGPEYAGKFIDLLEDCKVDVWLDTMVLHIEEDRTIHAVNTSKGYQVIHAGAIVLAMGCRERARGAIAIPGDRPSGILTAGAAQYAVNMEGAAIGKRVVILGSGDIGLIMARRMALTGAEVVCCIELMPYSGGLRRNIVQCLEDFHIPLHLSHTVVDVRGKNRLEQVVMAKVDAQLSPIPGTETVIDCDTLLLSVGLIPENELSRGAGVAIDPRTRGPIVTQDMQTTIPGIFACGNVVHVHDVVDYVSEESMRAGSSAANFAIGKSVPLPENEAANVPRAFDITTEGHATYTVPQRFAPASLKGTLELFFRVNTVLQKAVVTLWADDQILYSEQRRSLTPGEMEILKVPSEAVCEANGIVTLTVEKEAKMP